jgi:hypothetical protein
VCVCVCVCVHACTYLLSMCVRFGELRLVWNLESGRLCVRVCVCLHVGICSVCMYVWGIYVKKCVFRENVSFYYVRMYVLEKCVLRENFLL